MHSSIGGNSLDSVTSRRHIKKWWDKILSISHFTSYPLYHVAPQRGVHIAIIHYETSLLAACYQLQPVTKSYLYTILLKPFFALCSTNVLRCLLAKQDPSCTISTPLHAFETSLDFLTVYNSSRSNIRNQKIMQTSLNTSVI